MNNNEPTIRPKGYLYFVQSPYETGVIQQDYEPWEVDMHEHQVIGDLMSLVLDNCMGSGTCGVACQNLGRNFVGIELDEKYFEIAKGRLETTT